MMRNTVLAAAAAMAMVGCGTASAAQQGLASYYKSGHQTANGERFNPHGLTAAHRTLPFGTMVRVTNLKSGKSVVVRINDRGPFVKGRIIDVSKAAAGKLGFIRSGHTNVCIERLS